MSEEDKVLRGLIERIRNKGMQFAEIADYLGVHERTLFRWMAGVTNAPNMAYVALELKARGE